MIDPNDYVITRKRKKYKFAKFANSGLCFEFDEWTKRPVDIVELGAGTATFSVQMAAKHPSNSCLAVDVKADRLQKGAYQATEQAVANCQFLRARADQLTDCIAPGSVKQLWLTFPDPFPKKRSAGRRMTHPTFLKIYKSLLHTDGSLYLKHDDDAFFAWSLEQLVSEGWSIKELSFDLHESDLADDYKILTAYEKRWLADGATVKFVRATI